MHATSGIGSVIVMEDLPLAGVAPGANGREARAELGTVTARADVRHDFGREQSLAVQLAAVSHQLAQPSEVAKAGESWGQYT